MQTYNLHASLGNSHRLMRVYAENDEQATMAASFDIIREAYKEQDGPWALGEIKLFNPDGDLVRSMEAKDR